VFLHVGFFALAGSARLLMAGVTQMDKAPLTVAQQIAEIATAQVLGRAASVRSWEGSHHAYSQTRRPRPCAILADR
jgi:hypothetical protein